MRNEELGMNGGRCPHLIFIIVGDIANDVAIIINNACNSILESQAFLLSVFYKSKNPPDFPTIPNSSFLIPH